MALPIQESTIETLRKPPRKRSYTHHLTTTAAAQASSLALGVLSGVLAARLLGPQGRGELAALTLWPATIVFLLSIGLNQSVVFHLGRNTFSLSHVWTASTVIGLGQSLLTVLAGLVVIPVALRHYSHDVQIMGFAVLAVSPLIILGGYPTSILQGRLDLISFNLIQLASPCVYTAGVVVLALMHRGHLQDVVIWRVSSYVFQFVLAYVLLLRRTVLRFNWHSGACLSLLGFGWKTELGNVSNYVNRYVDQLVLSLFVPAHDLGLYAMAVTVALILNFIPTAAGMVALAAGSANAAEAAGMIGRSFRASLLWLLCGYGALFIAAPVLIIGILGPAYAGSVLACRILLPGAVAIGLNQVLYDGARALGDPALASYAEGCASLLTIVFLLLLLPRFGFVGAAIASSVAYCGSLCVALALYKSRCGVRPSQLLLMAKPA